MDLAMEWLKGPGGLVAWLAIVAIVLGTGLLMRHLALTTRTVELPRVILIVAASIGLLVVAGIGGFVLLHNA